MRLFPHEHFYIIFSGFSHREMWTVVFKLEAVDSYLLAIIIL